MIDIDSCNKKVDNEITVHKFMLLISVYPSGKVFPKMIPIGETKKQFSKKKVKGKVEFSQPGEEVDLL